MWACPLGCLPGAKRQGQLGKLSWGPPAVESLVQFFVPAYLVVNGKLCFACSGQGGGYNVMMLMILGTFACHAHITLKGWPVLAW